MTILQEMNEIQNAVRRQYFVWTREQKTRYEELLKLRREKVSYWIKNDMVAKPVKLSRDKDWHLSNCHTPLDFCWVGFYSVCVEEVKVSNLQTVPIV